MTTAIAVLPPVLRPWLPTPLFEPPLLASVAALEDVAELAASDVGLASDDVAAAVAPLRTEVTTTVTGPEVCPGAVGD